MTFSGTFSRRADSDIGSHSGLLCIDVDGCDDPAGMRAKLANDPFVQAAVVSPTSTGIKALVRINADADTHVACFAMARKHFEEAYEMSIDESCKNLSRLCYVAHDPDAFVRDEDAKLLVPLKPEPKAAGRTTPPARDIDIELTARCGPPFYASENDKLVINQNYFVQRICRENLVFFEHDENRFYGYNAENGAWEALAPGVIKESVRFEWERFTRLFNEPALAFKATDSFLHAFSGVESHSGRTKVFKRLKHTIHCANGMLKIASDGSWDLMPFSPAYYARNPIPIAWDKDATCSKFDALLAFALKPDDVSLFWRWFGSVLLTGNAVQRILLFIGQPLAGKSTIAEVVEKIIGLINCTALRTAQLHERFEIGRLFGYTLLSAKDIPSDFLEQDGAQALKTLVGHDYVPGERKGSMESVPVYGDFDCMITCNERLVVRLEGDTDTKPENHGTFYLSSAPP